VTTGHSFVLVEVILQCCVSAINKGDVKDTEIEAIMDCIVDSLFSVFVTLGELITMFVGLATTLVAWLSGRTSVFGRRAFSVLRSTCS